MLQQKMAPRSNFSSSQPRHAGLMQDDACASGCCYHSSRSSLQFQEECILTLYALTGKRKRPETDGALATCNTGSDDAEEERSESNSHGDEHDVSDTETDNDAAALRLIEETKYSEDGMGLKVEHISPEECAFLYEVRQEQLLLTNVDHLFSHSMPHAAVQEIFVRKSYTRHCSLEVSFIWKRAGDGSHTCPRGNFIVKLCNIAHM
jgi:hypothetical protein